MSTRISELPDIPDASQNNGYVQMNMHPNPYGNPPPNSAIMPPPVNAMLPDYNKAAAMVSQKPQMQLPSRDIPMDMSNYTHDDMTIPNYVPPPNRKDYVDSDSVSDENSNQRQRRREKRLANAEDIFDLLQRPIIIALLFFLFQMPALNMWIHRVLPFLNMFNGEGSITTWGITMKSVVFGCSVYVLDYVI